MKTNKIIFTKGPMNFSPFVQFVQRDKYVPFSGILKSYPNVTIPEIGIVLIFAQQLTRTVGVINLSQFLLLTVTIYRDTMLFTHLPNSCFPALDKSVYRDNFIVRRDWQKLRHGGLPAGTIPA
jgi:hypothetical protein